MEKNEKDLKVEEKESQDRLVIQLSKTYQFEGESIDTMDLRDLRNVTAADMIKVSRLMSMTGNVDNSEEMSLEYACVLAGTVTGRPVEFYKSLNAPDAMKLKNRVTGFLFGTI